VLNRLTGYNYDYISLFSRRTHDFCDFDIISVSMVCGKKKNKKYPSISIPNRSRHYWCVGVTSAARFGVLTTWLPLRWQDNVIIVFFSSLFLLYFIMIFFFCEVNSDAITCSGVSRFRSGGHPVTMRIKQKITILYFPSAWQRTNSALTASRARSVYEK
jgi:hypothetical protein